MVTVVLFPSDEDGLNSSLVGLTETDLFMAVIVVVVVEVALVVVVKVGFPAQV